MDCMFVLFEYLLEALTVNKVIRMYWMYCMYVFVINVCRCQDCDRTETKKKLHLYETINMYINYQMKINISVIAINITYSSFYKGYQVACACASYRLLLVA